ncbi:hypothetical protein PLUTE_b1320 [Pseudoalteromonas luteoviolacea DSM 6061]|nr:hypothetical protein [Pseudoalteromonas luteoviolacea DSM 6061]
MEMTFRYIHSLIYLFVSMPKLYGILMTFLFQGAFNQRNMTEIFQLSY